MHTPSCPASRVVAAERHQPFAERHEKGFSSRSRAMRRARGTWFFLVLGAVIGLALGVLVSVTTDVPLAPEGGLVLGALVGWLSRQVSA